MNTREVFSAEGTSHLNREGDAERHQSNALQIAWFEHICKRYSSEDIELFLQRIIDNGVTEAREKMIREADDATKRDIIMQEMILPVDLPDGSVERNWFRESFMDFAHHPEHREMIRRFVEKPEETEQILSDMDAIFRESITKH